jgi:hypothetical protein
MRNMIIARIFETRLRFERGGKGRSEAVSNRRFAAEFYKHFAPPFRASPKGRARRPSDWFVRSKVNAVALGLSWLGLDQMLFFC